MNIQFFQHHLLEKLSFLHYIAFVPLQKISCPCIWLKLTSSDIFIEIKKLILIFTWRDLPSNPAVKILSFHCGGPGLIPAEGTKISHAAHAKKKKKKGQLISTYNSIGNFNDFLHCNKI